MDMSSPPRGGPDSVWQGPIYMGVRVPLKSLVMGLGRTSLLNSRLSSQKNLTIFPGHI